MFDALQDRLQKVFKNLRIQGVLNEEVVDQSLAEVRLALLDADVNLNVVKELLDRVRVKALGEEVRASLSPTQTPGPKEKSITPTPKAIPRKVKTPAQQ